MSTSHDQVDEVLKAAKIEEIIGDYVKLKSSGKRFMGVCPFHGDKDPSFSVNPEKGLWYCFGCREGGNVFTFIKKIENVDFGEALHIIARRSGISLKTPVLSKEASLKERLMNAIKLVSQFYHEQLISSENGKIALEYLRGRRITPDTIRLFMMGYAPRGRQNALYYLRNRGIPIDEIEMAGIVMKASDTGELIDNFRHRITIPITDALGRFIGMGGRILDDSGPKYLNTPETQIFSKGRNLFGLHLAKKALGKEDCVVVVEGYMDQIQLYQQGIHNVVASLGTSITSEQAKLLKKFCSSCIIAYDSDQAGRLATTRGIEIFEEAGITPKVLVLPPGEDPDSMARKTDPGKVRAIFEGASDLMEYKIKSLKETIDLKTPEGKSQFIREILPLINEIRDPIRKDEYVKRISFESGVREEIIRKTRVDKKSVIHSHLGSLKQIVRAPSAEEKLLRFIIHHPGCLEHVRESLTISDISNIGLKPLYEALFSMYKKQAITISDFAAFIQDEGIMNTLTELIMGGDVPPCSDDSLKEYIRIIKDEKLRARFKELKKEVERLLSQNNMDRLDERFIEYQQLCQYFKGSK